MGDLSVKVINGAAAGVVGVLATFPLDLVKTNLQLNRVAYKGIGDCFKQLYVTGGRSLLPFYRGLLPNLLLISPEKAIKLTCNDVFRKSLLGKREHLPMLYECLAGGGAGFCQAIVTTPMELFKIKGQSQAKRNQTSQKPPSDATSTNHQSSNQTELKVKNNTLSKGTTSLRSQSALMEEIIRVYKRDGFRGMYKGVGSTLIRDVPFSMVYFPLFAHLNHSNLNEDGTSKPWWSLIAGVCAGAFSAWLFTPMDYVKTQIQSPNAPPGLTVKSVVSNTLKSGGGGISSFFTGAVPRVMVVAPLFGVAQATYYLGFAEILLGRQSWDKPTV